MGRSRARSIRLSATFERDGTAFGCDVWVTEVFDGGDRTEVRVRAARPTEPSAPDGSRAGVLRLEDGRTFEAWYDCGDFQLKSTELID